MGRIGFDDSYLKTKRKRFTNPLGFISPHAGHKPRMKDSSNKPPIISWPPATGSAPLHFVYKRAPNFNVGSGFTLPAIYIAHS